MRMPRRGASREHSTKPRSLLEQSRGLKPPPLFPSAALAVRPLPLMGRKQNAVVTPALHIILRRAPVATQAPLDPL